MKSKSVLVTDISANFTAKMIRYQGFCDQTAKRKDPAISKKYLF
ncbi:hypothetical protein ASZ90_011996 [hydrocarbon metagenome]|uniref:Uncharacterized protein n=1 Tax=hydrocarbon metagenome TaxID=938273 RepID=A0A0W8FD61_9ZZZZ